MIKLLQWNIWYKENIVNIISELKRFNADFVCMQELNIEPNDDKVTKLKTLYPYIYYEIADTIDNRSQCNAILSKYPIISTFKKYVQEPSSNKNDYSKEGRIYIKVLLDIDGKELTVGTTHLSYTHYFSETPLKDREVNTLIDCIKKERTISLRLI